MKNNQKIQKIINQSLSHPDVLLGLGPPAGLAIII